MKARYPIFSIILLSILMSSCAKVFYSPNAKTVAQSHEELAIIPPSVSISASKKVDAESMKEQQRTESLNFQKEIHAWLLKRKSKGQFACNFQSPDDTNALLAQAGFPETPLTTVQMCEILNVDAIIRTNIGLSKPMSEGAAIAVGVLAGASGVTNEVRVNYSINDCSSKELIFSYDHRFSGGLGSSATRLVDDMMRQISKKMPHFVQ